MMNSTADLQVNLQAGPRHRWPDRVAQAHRIGPMMLAISAGQHVRMGSVLMQLVALDLPQSLLALQAGVYRYGESLHLAAPLIDKASSAVKTVVQGP